MVSGIFKIRSVLKGMQNFYQKSFQASFGIRSLAAKRLSLRVHSKIPTLMQQYVGVDTQMNASFGTLRIVNSRYLDPKIDISFKRVFGIEENKIILMHFLNAVLKLTENGIITDIKFLSTLDNPEIFIKNENIIYAMDDNGTKYIVEMQLKPYKGYVKRALFYAASVYAKQLKKRSDNTNIKKVCYIAISDQILFENDAGYISTFPLRDETTYEQLKDVQLTFIELPKFFKTKADQLETDIERWCYFFKHAHDATDADLNEIAKNARIIRLAFDKLDALRWHEDELSVYNERRINIKMEASIAEIRDKSFLAAKSKIAINLLRKGRPAVEVAIITGIPLADIEDLGEKI